MSPLYKKRDDNVVTTLTLMFSKKSPKNRSIRMSEHKCLFEKLIE